MRKTFCDHCGDEMDCSTGDSVSRLGSGSGFCFPGTLPAINKIEVEPRTCSEVDTCTKCVLTAIIAEGIFVGALSDKDIEWAVKEAKAIQPPHDEIAQPVEQGMENRHEPSGQV